MSAAEGRTANRVQVPEGDQGQGDCDCACALCRELARALPDVREIFHSHAQLFRENAELKLQLYEEKARNANLEKRLTAMHAELVELRRRENGRIVREANHARQ